MKISQGIETRRTAIHILEAILDAGNDMDGAFAGGEAALSKMSAPDRRFTGLLVRTYLRRRGHLGLALDTLMDRALPGPRVFTRRALKLGLAQLLILEMAPHARRRVNVHYLMAPECHG